VYDPAAAMEPLRADDIEELDGELVATAAPVPATTQRPAGVVMARQAAAVAATSFAAGVATVAAVRVGRARRARRRSRKLPAVVASRSFLVDVHVLGPRN
jgi:hypothetical protein